MTSMLFAFAWETGNDITAGTPTGGPVRAKETCTAQLFQSHTLTECPSFRGTHTDWFNEASRRSVSLSLGQRETSRSVIWRREEKSPVIGYLNDVCLQARVSECQSSWWQGLLDMWKYVNSNFLRSTTIAKASPNTNFGIDTLHHFCVMDTLKKLWR